MVSLEEEEEVEVGMSRRWICKVRIWKNRTNPHPDQLSDLLICAVACLEILYKGRLDLHQRAHVRRDRNNDDEMHGRQW